MKLKPSSCIGLHDTGRLRKCFPLIVAFALLAFASGASAAEVSDNSPSRAQWFRDAKFGLFLHWGLYSVPAGEWGIGTDFHEWFQLQAGLSNTDYAKFADQFNPTRFNAREWVRIATNAGMKYIVITAKHHEGFCMFDSALTDYTITKATSWKRDPMKELAVACKEAGIKLCFFYAMPDWHHPEMPAQYNQHGFHGGPRPDADISKYLEYTRGQVKELLTQYGPIGCMWFDGGAAFRGGNRASLLEADKMVQMIHELQPACLINSRLGVGADYDTPEQIIPAVAGRRPFEVCMTLNKNWGYNKHDDNWKSARTVIENLIVITSRGGNYLLNVGPTGEGEFPAPAVQVLNQVGKWMQVNHEAIHNTSASPFQSLPWGHCTSKQTSEGTLLYLHVFNWPASGTLSVPGLKSPVRNAFLLSDPGRKALSTRTSSGGLLVTLPKDVNPDPISSTIVLAIDGKPEIEQPLLAQEADGSFKLTAKDAFTHGTQVAYQHAIMSGNIGYWTNPSDWVEWRVNVTKPGKFTISAEIAAVESASFTVNAGKQTLTNASTVTGSYAKYETVELGTLELSTTGKTLVSIHPVADGWRAMNLKSLCLKPQTLTAVTKAER